MPFAGKTKAACFHCRKTFVTYDRVRSVASLPCPQYKREMWNAGVHFKSPKQTDVAQWAKVRLLAAHGFRYTNVQCCGWYAPGARPRRLQDVAAFVAGQTPVSEEAVAAQVRVARRAYR